MADDGSASLKTQMTFSGAAADCDEFRVNRARLNMCVFFLGLCVSCLFSRFMGVFFCRKNAKVTCVDCSAALGDHRSDAGTFLVFFSLSLFLQKPQLWS
jgi:hypothetical protein